MVKDYFILLVFVALIWSAVVYWGNQHLDVVGLANSWFSRITDMVNELG